MRTRIMTTKRVRMRAALTGILCMTALCVVGRSVGARQTFPSGRATQCVDVKGGSFHTLVLKSDGTVWACGDNTYGELGDGTTLSRDTLVRVKNLLQVTAIAAAASSSLALRADGTVWAWGDNQHGELGMGTLAESNLPTPVSGLTDVVAISAGGDHCLALRSDGTVWGWGDNGYGELGNGAFAGNSGFSQTVPVQAVNAANMGALTGVFSIAAGGYHSLALMSDGTVLSWGYNVDGELGNGATTDTSIPAPVGGLTQIKAIVGGLTHSLALRSDGTVWAWGANGSEQCGFETFAQPALSPGQVTSQTSSGYLNDVVAISAGGYQSMAIATSGAVVAWGSAQYGQLGDGKLGGSSVAPEPTGVNSGAVAIACGLYHSLAIGSDNAVYAWGENDAGQLGAGASGSAGADATPTPIGGLAGFVGVAGGGFHSLALKSDGTVWSWGLNTSGELGDGGTANTDSPMQTTGLADAVALAGGQFHSVAVRSDGTVWAWGDNTYGQLGNGSTTGSVSPVAVSSLGDVVAITAGGEFNLALMSDGSVWAWGANAAGQLGNGASVNSTAPVRVIDSTLTGYIANVVAVAAGDSFSLALKSDGTVWAWGDDQYNELGAGATGSSSAPIQVTGLANIVAIAAGGAFGLALRSDGTIWAWGDDQYGQLGDAVFTVAPSFGVAAPVQVFGLSSVSIAGIAAGEDHGLALESGGAALAWGFGGDGELGDAFTSNVATPQSVVGANGNGALTGVVALAAGSSHSLALRSDGTIWDWGYGFFGELGNGGTNSSAIPVPVSSAPSVSGLAPSSVIMRSAALTLTVNGAGFIDGAVVYWNGAPLPSTFVSGYQLTASVPARLVSFPGTARITVVTPVLGN